MIIDVETLQCINKPIASEYEVIDGNKYYRVTQHVWAVITYRILRACSAVQRRQIGYGDIREILQRYFALGNYVLRTQGSEWVSDAEQIAEQKLAEREAA